MDNGPPPVTPLEPRLDFHPLSAAAGYEWFQNLTADILRASTDFSGVENIGVSGEVQEGLDIRALFQEREQWGFQCKQEREFGPSKVTEAIQAVPNDASWPASQYRILLSRNATDLARARAKETPGWDIIDAADLCRMVRDLPVEAGEAIVRQYFGEYWVERFFGIDRARVFVAPERYYRPFRNHDLLLHHDRPLRGRSGELDALTEWQDGTSRAMLVSGRPGIGVSKLLYDYALQASGTLFMPLVGQIIDAAALHEIPAGPVLFIVDDEQLDRLQALLAHIAHDPQKRVVIGCTSARVQAYTDTLFRAGVPATDVAHLRLERLARQATIEVAHDVEPAISDDYVENLVLRASDTPLATIVTAKLIVAPSTSAAVSIYNEATARYRDLIQGQIVPDVPRAHIRTIVRLVAALGPVRPGSPTLLVGAERFGVPDADARRAIAAIRGAGGFAELGEKIAVSPSVVRDSVLIDACTNGDEVDPFVASLYEVFSFEDSLFANLASANDAAQAIGKPAFFDGLWQRLLHDVMPMDQARRRSFVIAIRKMALHKPSDIVRVCRNLHFNAPEDDRQDYEFIRRVRADEVDDEISAVLGDILEQRSEFAESIVPLLWDIGQADSRPLNAHPNAAVRVLRDAIDFDGATPAARTAIIEAVAGLLDRADLNETVHSPVEVLAPVLALQGDSSRSRGEKFVLRQFGLAISKLTPIRDRALDLIIEALAGPSERRAILAMGIAARLLAAVIPYSDAPDDIARLRAEQDRVLDAFQHLAGSPAKLRQVALRDELLRYSRRSDDIGERIDHVIASIILDDEAQLIRAVAPSLAQHWKIDGDIDGSGFTAHHAQLNTERRVVAQRLLGEENAEVLRDTLESVAGSCAAAGLVSFLPPLLGAIAAEDIDRAIAVCDISMDERVSPHLSGALAAIIIAALIHRPEAGRRLIDVAQSGSERMRCVGAIALDAQLQSDDVASSEVQHRFAATVRAMNDTSSAVRSAARPGAAHLVRDVPALLIPVIDAFGGNEGSDLDWIYSEIRVNDAGGVALEDHTYEQLARRLISLKRLEYHEVRLLGAGIVDHAAVVFDVVGTRFRNSIDADSQALPHDPTSKPLVDAIVRHRRVDAAVAMAARVLDENVVRQYDIEYFVGDLWLADASQVRDAVLAEAQTADTNRMRFLPSLLSRAPVGQLVGDPELLVGIIESAYRSGYDIGERVGTELERSLVHRPHTRTGRNNTEELLQLEAALIAALMRVPQGSDSEAFFARLLQTTRREMSWEDRIDNEAFGPQ